MTQNGHAHEIPVYGEIFADDTGKPIIGWAMHGPQEPLEIGVEAPSLLPYKGVNPYTGQDRLQFERARPVPWVHSMLVEWYDYKRDTYWHWEGGVRIHQVAAKKVWYQKSGYGDDGSVSANPDKAWVITGKVIFMQRMILDSAGQPAVAASCTNYAKPGSTVQIAGGPSTFTLEHRGTKNYPKFTKPDGTEFTKLVVKVQEAKFNPTRIEIYKPFFNRQGMVVDADGFHDLTHHLGPADMHDGQLASDWKDWKMGDDIPNADVLATIQH